MKSTDYKYANSTKVQMLFSTLKLRGFEKNDIMKIGSWYSRKLSRWEKGKNALGGKCIYFGKPKVDIIAIRGGLKCIGNILNILDSFKNPLQISSLSDEEDIRFICENTSGERIIIQLKLNTNNKYAEIVLNKEYVETRYLILLKKGILTIEQCAVQISEHIEEDINKKGKEDVITNNQNKVTVLKKIRDELKDYNTITLTPEETCAYWWMNIIRNKIRELLISYPSNLNEQEFLKIFKNYNDKDWRHLYLNLSIEIKTSCRIGNRSNIYSITPFLQSTIIGGHEYLNVVLSKILKTNIPDINLSKDNSEETLSMVHKEVKVLYKYGLQVNLPPIYEKDYILSGEKKYLDFYYLLIAIIFRLRNKNFNSIPILKESFINLYSIQSGLSSAEINFLFNKYWGKLCDEGIVFGNFDEEIYHSYFSEYLIEKIYLEIQPFLLKAEIYEKEIIDFNSKKSVGSILKKG